MSTLQVANVHLESTGNNRIQYDGSNTFTIAAGDANVAVINSTAVSVSTDMSIDGETTANAVNATSLSVSGTAVINSTAGLTNISAIDSTTATAIENSISTGGMMTVNVITSNTTYSLPADCVGIKVIIAGGGGGAATYATGPNDSRSDTYVEGFNGGIGIKYIPAPNIPAPVSVTVGAGGTGGTQAGTPNPADAQRTTNGGNGGTSSFGTYVTATGGAGALSPAPGTPNQSAGIASNADFYSVMSILSTPGANPAVIFGTPRPESFTKIGILKNYETVNTLDDNWSIGGINPNAITSGGDSVDGYQGVVIIEEYY